MISYPAGPSDAVGINICEVKYDLCNIDIFLINQQLALFFIAFYTPPKMVFETQQKGIQLSSPVSVFLRNLRLQIGLSQVDMPRSIGYEHGYVSAVELGLKNPSKEFVARLTSEIKLTEQELVALAEAQRMSNRRFTLPPEVSTVTFEFCVSGG